MNIEEIKNELERIRSAPFASKSDAQLWAYDTLSKSYKEKLRGSQPEPLRRFNSTKNRTCKLTLEQVNEIREKYSPFLYGKLKLAREFGVSKAVINRIIKRESWKVNPELNTESLLNNYYQKNHENY